MKFSNNQTPCRYRSNAIVTLCGAMAAPLYIKWSEELADGAYDLEYADDA